MKLLSGSGLQLQSNPRRGHRRDLGRVGAVPLLAALALCVSACYDPSDPAQVTPFIISIFVFIAVCFAVALLGTRLLMNRLLGGFGGLLPGTDQIKGGLPGTAVIQGISDTGVTVTMPSVGPNAPDYQFVLEVTPAAGGAPYQVTTKALIPRIYVPMIVPGAQVGVLIDPANPNRVSIDFSTLGRASAGPAQPVATGAGTMDFNFDASGRPMAGEVSSLLGAVQSGQLPTIKGSAAQLLATGTHGTAVITTCQPMGKTVRDLDPSADPSHLDDPMWLFTVEATLAGQAPFPAVFGHRVPMAKAGLVAPGVKLAVAVDQSNKNQDVAIDWDRSPIAG